MVVVLKRARATVDWFQVAQPSQIHVDKGSVKNFHCTNHSLLQNFVGSIFVVKLTHEIFNQRYFLHIYTVTNLQDTVCCTSVYILVMLLL